MWELQCIITLWDSMVSYMDSVTFLQYHIKDNTAEVKTGLTAVEFMTKHRRKNSRDNIYNLRNIKVNSCET
jgi:hypothetical protein